MAEKRDGEKRDKIEKKMMKYRWRKKSKGGKWVERWKEREIKLKRKWWSIDGEKNKKAMEVNE